MYKYTYMYISIQMYKYTNIMYISTYNVYKYTNINL